MSAPSDERPTFETERLRAEPVTKEHASVMAQVLADPMIHRYLTGGPETEEQLRRRYEFLEGGWSRDRSQRWWTWIVSVRDGEAIGFVEATIEDPELFYVAYVLNPAWWRLGYGREATVALIDLIFDRFEVTRCVVEMDTPNLASIALAESLGFRRIDTVIDPADGAEEHVYEITRAEWSRRRSAPANH